LERLLEHREEVKQTLCGEKGNERKMLIIKQALIFLRVVGRGTGERLHV